MVKHHPDVLQPSDMMLYSLSLWCQRQPVQQVLASHTKREYAAAASQTAITAISNPDDLPGYPLSCCIWPKIHMIAHLDTAGL